MAKVVITGRIPAIAVEQLRAQHDVVSWDEPVAITREELLKRVKGADAIVSLLTEKVDAELLDAAPHSSCPVPVFRRMPFPVNFVLLTGSVFVPIKYSKTLLVPLIT